MGKANTLTAQELRRVQDYIATFETLRKEFNKNIPACIVTADTSPQHLSMF